jgi:hypothetical protein
MRRFKLHFGGCAFGVLDLGLSFPERLAEALTESGVAFTALTALRDFCLTNPVDPAHPTAKKHLVFCRKGTGSA